MTAHPTPQNWMTIALLGLIWGGTFMVVAIALEGYGPLTVACARTTLGAVAMLGLRWALGRPWPVMRGAALRFLLLIGAFNTAIPFMLLSWGQQFVPSAFVGTSMAILPLIILPLSAIFADEVLHLRRVLGVLIGFAGALILIGPGLVSMDLGPPLAQMACLAAVVAYSIASVATRVAPDMDPIAMAACTLSIGAVILVPTMLAFEGVPHWVGMRSGTAIVFLGLFPTALAALLRVVVIRSAGPVFMTLVNYQVPLWSMLFGTWVLNEALPGRFFLALVVILCGLAVSQWRSLMGVLRR